MITPFDEDYKLTKLIKQEKAHLPFQFEGLSDWIKRIYGVKPLNIIYDTIDSGNRGRLHIIFEFADELEKFKIPGEIFIYDLERENAIAEYFIRSKREEDIYFFDSSKESSSLKNMFVIFSAFEPIAREEANNNISEEQITALRDQIQNKDLWTISHQFARATFFFYTDEQIRKNDSIGLRKDFGDRYFDLLKTYDEFNYFKRERFTIELDSKENFDKNFQSNWYYYYL